MKTLSCSVIDALVKRNKSNKVAIAKIIRWVIHNSMPRCRSTKLKQAHTFNPLLITKNIAVELSHHIITNQLAEVMNLPRRWWRLHNANGELLMAPVRSNGQREESPRQMGWSTIDDLKTSMEGTREDLRENSPCLALVEVEKVDGA